MRFWHVKTWNHFGEYEKSQITATEIFDANKLLLQIYNMWTRFNNQSNSMWESKRRDKTKQIIRNKSTNNQSKKKGAEETNGRLEQKLQNKRKTMNEHTIVCGTFNYFACVPLIVFAAFSIIAQDETIQSLLSCWRAHSTSLSVCWLFISHKCSVR